MNLYNGKGDRPRNIFTRAFQENFDKISWGRSGSRPRSGRPRKCSCIRLIQKARVEHRIVSKVHIV